MNVKVTLVIPAHRTAATLGRTLASVCAQRVSDWEAIVIDDGSGDNTADVAREWCARDPRIRLIEARHGGASAARNRGLREARGEWVVFLDADDTIQPGFLAKMLRAAGKSAGKVDVVACGFDRVDPAGRVTAKISPLPLDQAPLLVCAAGPPGAIHSFLVKRELLERVGGFDESLTTGEDWDLWLRIAVAGARFKVIDRRLVTYWSSPNSLSRNGPRMLTDGRIVMERARAVAPAAVKGLELFDHGSFSIDDLSLRNAFWSAGVAIGQGGTALELIDAIPTTACATSQLYHLSENFLDGLIVGSSTPLHGMIALWPTIRPHVSAFIEHAMTRIDSKSGGRSLMRTCDLLIARNGVFSGSVPLGHVEAVALQPRHLLRGHSPAAGCEAVVLRATWLRPATYFSFAAPVFGRMTPRDVVTTISRSISRRAALRLRSHPRGLALAERIGRVTALTRQITGRGRNAEAPIRPLNAAQARAAQIAATLGPAPTPPSREDHAGFHPGTGSSAAEWDRFFQTEDPWNYGSPYEQLKYRRTLDLIPVPPGARALELACAEGRFTQMLASRVDRLVAADISETAIERARRRTAGQGNVEFRQHDLFTDSVPTGFDIITCSEVLYFTPSLERLDWLAGEIAGALNPGGYFAHAHAYEVGDSPGRTAFDWADTVGAQGIHAAFAARPELALVRTIETDLYRIDLFQRVAASAARPEAQVERLPIGARIEPAVAGGIVWNGAILTRSAAASRPAYRLPVLKLEGRNAEQLDTPLRFLRRRGYASVTPEQWALGAARAGRLQGRPVMLLAEDPGEGERRTLWDAVRRNGFGLHLIVRSDAGTAALDECVSEGMTIGSGLASGRPSDDLSHEELLEEALVSRIELERQFGVSVDTAYPPIDLSSTFVEQVFTAAGYRRLFIDDAEELAPVVGQSLATPVMRLPVGLSLERLAEMLGPDVEAPDAGDLR